MKSTEKIGEGIIKVEVCFAASDANSVGFRPCNDKDHKMSECEHAEGIRYKSYDEDGCGYYSWICISCGFEEIDDMP